MAYQEYCAIYQKVGKAPDARHNDSIVLAAYSKIEEAGIWIPMSEVEKYYFSRKNAYRNRHEKELARAELLAEAKEGDGVADKKLRCYPQFLFGTYCIMRIVAFVRCCLNYT